LEWLKKKSDMSKFIIHLGYPKTGTTYLQRKIFTQLIDNYVVITPEFENCGVNIRRLKYLIQSGRLPKKIKPAIAGKDVIISLEGLLFDPMRNVRNDFSLPLSWPNALQGLRLLCADRLEEEIELVIYLRRQDELLHSLYAESKTYHFNQSDRLNTIEKYIESVLSEDALPSDPGYYYDFNNTINEVRDIFPNNTLHVRFFEDLEHKPDEEIKFWSELCGHPLKRVEGRENSRQKGDGIKLADSSNQLRYILLKLKKRYCPGLKLPNKLSRIAKGILTKAATRKQESVLMTKEMRARLCAKYKNVNLQPPVNRMIPEHLRQDYFASGWVNKSM